MKARESGALQTGPVQAGFREVTLLPPDYVGLVSALAHRAMSMARFGSGLNRQYAISTQTLRAICRINADVGYVVGTLGRGIVRALGWYMQ